MKPISSELLRLVQKHYILAIYLCIAFAAALLRFWDLDGLPLALYRDETWNGVEGLLTAQKWDFRPFYEGSTGREGMLIWLIALTHLFLEPSAFAVRFANAAVGTVTVLSLPLLLIPLMRFFYFVSCKQEPGIRERQLFWVVALVAMFFLASSYWHLTYSRITFRAILDPLFCLASCSFVAMSYQRPRHFWLAALAGVVCGLGLYGYGAVKFIVLPLFVIFVCAACSYKTKVIVPTALITVFAALTVFPLFQYIIQNSDSYFLRLNQVSIFRKESPSSEFFDSLTSMLGMLGGLGDGNLRHNHNRNAQLNPVFFACFILGLLGLIVQVARPRKDQQWLKYLSLFSLLWLLVMLIPSALTYEGQPHSLRSIGMLMPLVIFAGTGFLWVFWSFQTSSRVSKKIHLALGIIAFSLVYETASSYFYRYANYPGVKNWFDYSVNQAAMTIRHDSTDQVYLVVVDNKHDPERHSVIQTFRYLTKLEIDAATNSNILRLRDLPKHPDKEHAIVFSPNNIKHRVQKIVGDTRRVKTY